MMKTPTRIAMIAALAAAFLAAGGKDRGPANGPGAQGVPAAAVSAAPAGGAPVSHTQLASNLSGPVLLVNR